MKQFSYIFKRENGFTLIELLLYLAVAVVMLLAIVQLLNLVLQSRVKSQAMNEVEQQGAQIVQRVLQAMRNASAINSPAAGTAAVTLSLGMLDATKNPTIFDFTGNTVRIKEGTGSPIPLNSNKVIISNLRFDNFSKAATPGTIRVEFTIRYLNPDNRNEYQYQKVFSGSASRR